MSREPVPQAKYKSWFQLLAAMRAIDHDWTISGLLLDDAEDISGLGTLSFKL